MCTDSKMGDLSGFPKCAVSGHELGNPQTTPNAGGSDASNTQSESLDKSYKTSDEKK